MLAFIEISINIVVLAAIIAGAVSLGFLINQARLKKQQKSILKLEAEMLRNHAEILHLQKELSEKENLHSKTPIFSIADNAVESIKEQVSGARLSKKVSGGSKSTS